MTPTLTQTPVALARAAPPPQTGLPPSAILQLALLQEQEHALIVLDQAGRVVAWLGNAPRLFGYTADDMVGSTLERLYTAEDTRRGDPEFALDAARTHGRAEDDRWHVRKDGVRVWTSGVTTVVQDARGEHAGFVKVARDRTSMRAEVEALQNRVDDAARSEGRRNVVLGLLAHELRNPLGEIGNAAHVIGRIPSADPRVDACVRIIGRQVAYIENVLHDLLETTRDALGKSRLRYDSVELRAVAERAVESSAGGLRARNQSVEITIPESLRIECDEVRLQQVLVNLLVNASKYSPPGTAIRIDASAEGDEAVIRVRDRGQGIAPELLPRIFELFTQVGAEGEEAGHGLGLGLRVVKNIVEMHGGTVLAASEGIGKGAEFTVRLPLRKP